MTKSTLKPLSLESRKQTSGNRGCALNGRQHTQKTNPCISQSLEKSCFTFTK